MKPKNPIKIGEKFHRLTVRELHDRIGGSRQKYYVCDCSCGQVRIARGSSLRAGAVKSCGCLQAEISSLVHRGAPGDISYNDIERTYKGNAKARGYAWGLSRLEFRALVSGDCFWCGRLAQKYNTYYNSDGERRKNDLRTTKECADLHWINAHGIDRLDNKEGYVSINCVPACEICNKMKLHHSESFFLSHIEKIFNHRRNK